MPSPFPLSQFPVVLMEDVHVLVVNKPAGLAAQGGEGLQDRNVVDWARSYLGRHYVGLIHRLDRNVSGTLLIGKRSKASERLTRALQQGKICRVYHGWVEGTVSEAQEWRDGLIKNAEQRRSQITALTDPLAKSAIMKARPLGHRSWNSAPATLMEFTLETGRYHQIRAQASAHGHPLIGDAKYGAKTTGDRSTPPVRRPLLHAFLMTFPHPMTGETVRVEAPYAADFFRLDRVRSPDTPT